MKKLYSTAMMALASVALLTIPASAQQPTVYNDGDLFIGFRSPADTNNYLINIGQPGQFRDAAPGSTITLSLGNIGADLTTVFGANWFSRTDVFYALISGRFVGNGVDPDNTLYTSNPNATSFNRRSNNAQSATSTLTTQLGEAYAGNIDTVNSNGGLIQAAGGPNSYASFQPGGPNSGGISFQAFNPSNEGIPSQSLFFNRLAPSSTQNVPGQVLGSFSLDSSGNLSFQAVPEPSTYALVGAGLALFAVAARRRRRALKA